MTRHCRKSPGTQVQTALPLPCCLSQAGHFLLNGANTGTLLMRLLPGFREVRGAEVKTIRDAPKQATNQQAGEGVIEGKGLEPDHPGQILFLEPVP